MSTSYSVPQPVAGKIRKVRARQRSVGVATAVVVGLSVLLAGMGLAMLIDYLATLYDSPLRRFLTIATLIAAGLTAIGWAVRIWRRSRSDRRVASAVDLGVPELEERWSTVAALAEADQEDGVAHPAIFQQVAGEATRWEPHVDPKRVVHLEGLTRAFLILNAVTLTLLLATIFDWQQTAVLLKRFWSPSASITATRIEEPTGNILVGRGEPLFINAYLEGKPVEEASLAIQQNEKEKLLKLTPRGDSPAELKHRIRSVKQSMKYRLAAGDDRTEWFQVTVADRPEIGKVRLLLTPPAYTGHKSKELKKLPRRLSALKGTRLDLRVQTKREVTRFELSRKNGSPEVLPLDSDGWHRWSVELEEGFEFELRMTESHGLKNRRPPVCQISVYPDRPPVVRVLSPDDTIAVRPDDTIEIEFTAEDDIGVGAAELVVFKEPMKAGDQAEILATLPIDLGEQSGRRRVRATTELDLSQFPVQDGESLSYAVRVDEQRGQQTKSVAQATSAKNESVANEKTPADSNDAERKRTTAEEQLASVDTEQALPSTSNGVPSNSPQAETQPSDSDLASQTQSSEPVTDSPQAAGELNQEIASIGEAFQAQPSPSNQATANAATPEGQSQSTTNPSRSNKNGKPSEEQSATAPLNAKSEPTEAAETAMRDARPNSDETNEAQETKFEKSADNATSDSAPTSEKMTKESTSAQGKSSDSFDNAANPSGTEDAETPKEPRSATTDRRNVLTTDEDAEMEGSQNPTETSDSQQANPSENPSINPDGTMRKSPEKASPGKESDQNEVSQPSDSANVENDSTGQLSEKNPSSSSQNANRTQSNRSQSSSSPNAEQSQNQAASDPPPADDMQRRSLDVPQSGSSQRMGIKVDKWAGSFEGQRRAKLEMAIAPRLARLDKLLASSEKISRNLLDALEEDPNWQVRHDREVDDAAKPLDESLKLIADLGGISRGTPYAFIGLQLSDIGLAHIEPANDQLWKALQTGEDRRQAAVQAAWQHTVRARELLAGLQKRYEGVKTELEFAERTERVKQMYRVFIEDTFAMLSPSEDGNSKVPRKIAEFELDEEYLKRLREVLEMRRDLRAELARILAEDPRLLRRFMDSLRNRASTFRKQLSEIRQDQELLAEEIAALSGNGDNPAELLTGRFADHAGVIAADAADLNDHYEIWMPLNKRLGSSELVEAETAVERAAGTARQLQNAADRFVTSDPDQAADAIEELREHGESLQGHLREMQAALLQAQPTDDSGQLGNFVLNRLAEAARLNKRVGYWMKQLAAYEDGEFHRVGEIAQLQLAENTDALAAELGNVEQTLAITMQRQDNTLPADVAQHSRALMNAFDKQILPNQYRSGFALRKNTLPLAEKHTEAAAATLRLSEKEFDKMVAAAVKYLDELPVEDPIASLLRDPTLDELLAALEQERNFEDVLGIPPRRSNLQTMSDWTNPSNGGGGGGGMLMAQLRQEQQRMRRAARRAQQRAMARARRAQETARLKKPKSEKRRSTAWNKLASELEDGILQGDGKLPPADYRSAIEQYFELINEASKQTDRGIE